MSIIGQNSLLNQYVPTFYIDKIADGQILVYDRGRKAFVNTSIKPGDAGGATKLGQLINVSPNVDSVSPLILEDGQALVYDDFSKVWENKFFDYNKLLNKPLSPADFTGLGDVTTPSLPNGYVLWNSDGTRLVYSTTIPASSISGLPNGSVTSVSVVTANGVSGTVSTADTTPAITLSLGNITPTSVAAAGTVTGTNLTGSNTGDQTITLTGDVTGSGTSTFSTALSTTGVTADIYGSSTVIPVITVDTKGRITNVVNTPILVSSGTVTSLSVSATDDVTGSVATPNTTPAISLNLANTTVTAGSYTRANVTVDAKGRITQASSGTTADDIVRVVFQYSAGSAGNFSGGPPPPTSGVEVTITDAANCIATYKFTGRTHPPKSILTYAQVYTSNTFIIRDTSTLPSAFVAGGGTSAAPSILNGFTDTNTITLQTRMSDVGASAGLGQRAYLIIVFGF
jgi:hypothetical protein